MNQFPRDNFWGARVTTMTRLGTLPTGIRAIVCLVSVSMTATVFPIRSLM